MFSDNGPPDVVTSPVNMMNMIVDWYCVQVNSYSHEYSVTCFTLNLSAHFFIAPVGCLQLDAPIVSIV